MTATFELAQFWRSKKDPSMVFRVELNHHPSSGPPVIHLFREEGEGECTTSWSLGEAELRTHYWPAEDGYLPPNPKKALGAGKPDLSLVPSVAITHTAMAFEDGGYKYGPYNWRERAVEARTYIAAAKRHLNDFLDGTDFAEDSEVHNLGHVMACCAILLDAQAQGNLIDNRPIKGKSAEVHDEMKALKSKFRKEGRKQWSAGSKM